MTTVISPSPDLLVPPVVGTVVCPSINFINITDFSSVVLPNVYVASSILGNKGLQEPVLRPLKVN